MWEELVSTLDVVGIVLAGVSIVMLVAVLFMLRRVYAVVRRDRPSGGDK